jgi:hypothetical protein
MHVLALRLYTTAAFRSLNGPMRDTARVGPHALSVTVNCIAEGIRRLRAVDAASADANEEVILYRGLKDLKVPASFLKSGGTELAPMSTTTDLAVALKYSASANSSVLLCITTSNFMARGADLTWLSAFPAECEKLYPPLTYLEPVAGKQEPPIEIREVVGCARMLDSASV